MSKRQKLFIALILGMLFHGTSVFFTFESTYDAYVHIFFADHYASDWFSTWDTRWYTGFTTTSYPPLVHQVIGALSFVFGLKGGFIIWSFVVTLTLIRGVFVFSRLWVGEHSAFTAAIIAVFSSSFTEALHIFGQLPSLTGIAFLLNACPELYKWMRWNNRSSLFLGLSFLAVTTSAHHVTTIFGLVFFILPVLGLSVIDRAQTRIGNRSLHLSDFLREVWAILPKAIALCTVIVLIIIIVVFPYWYWSKSDPITQVPIPHGSRDSYIDVASSGLVFFLIPWGMMLFFLPYLVQTIFTKRNLFIGLSISLLFVLGTGGTTPIPKMILGSNAFEILTLDRFTFWATILSLPFWGDFLVRIYKTTRDNSLSLVNLKLSKILLGFILAGTLLTAVLTVNFKFFRSTQPDKIDIKPIVDFLNVDKHYKWRYLTLGFGDQMAWLSANTKALSVDGNYHSVRRLPEMTSRAVERLENAKYLGDEGLEALRQFLTVPESYNLKFIFSNDKFYDPLLYYSGWEKIRQLDNNIIVWERPDVPMVPSVLPAKDLPAYQKYMWGIIPLSCLFLCVVLFSARDKTWDHINLIPGDSRASKPLNHKEFYVSLGWTAILGLSCTVLFLHGYITGNDKTSAENVVKAYFHAIDFKQFEKAHSLHDPDKRPPMDEFLVQTSLKSGILSSYAKLDSISISWFPGTSENEKIAIVDAYWITALRKYSSRHSLNLVRKGIFWYLYPEFPESYIPPDRLLSLPELRRFKHGRRKLNMDKLRFEDVFDKPEVHVHSSTLIYNDGRYSIIGTLTNVDNDPAFVTIDGVLYDENNNEIIRYTAADIIKHTLAPLESTPFRIDFSTALATLDLENHAAPVYHRINIRTMVTDSEGYAYTGIHNVSFDEGIYSGTLHNFGDQLAVIPQILVSYQSRGTGDLIWVDAVYLPEGIGQQRSRLFSFPGNIPESCVSLHNASTSDIYINGLSMEKSLYLDRLPNPLFAGFTARPESDTLISLKTNIFTASIYTE